jgi:NitT/TauT family transport system ATP-binding protein
MTTAASARPSSTTRLTISASICHRAFHFDSARTSGKSTPINMVSGPSADGRRRGSHDGQLTRRGFLRVPELHEAMLWLGDRQHPLSAQGDGVPSKERRQRVVKLLADFEARIDLNAYPTRCRQQMVSILRALSPSPRFCSGRPFSALDYEK